MTPATDVDNMRPVIMLSSNLFSYSFFFRPVIVPQPWTISEERTYQNNKDESITQLQQKHPDQNTGDLFLIFPKENFWKNVKRKKHNVIFLFPRTRHHAIHHANFQKTSTSGPRNHALFPTTCWNQQTIVVISNHSFGFKDHSWQGVLKIGRYLY